MASEVGVYDTPPSNVVLKVNEGNKRIPSTSRSHGRASLSLCLRRRQLACRLNDFTTDHPLVCSIIIPPPLIFKHIYIYISLYLWLLAFLSLHFSRYRGISARVEERRNDDGPPGHSRSPVTARDLIHGSDESLLELQLCKSNACAFMSRSESHPLWDFSQPLLSFAGRVSRSSSDETENADRRWSAASWSGDVSHPHPGFFFTFTIFPTATLLRQRNSLKCLASITRLFAIIAGFSILDGLHLSRRLIIDCDHETIRFNLTLISH